MFQKASGLEHVGTGASKVAKVIIKHFMDPQRSPGLNQLLKDSGIPNPHKFVKEVQNIPVNIREVLHTRDIKKLSKLIKETRKNVGGGKSKILTGLLNFVNGKTKYKPSQLMKDMSTLSELASTGLSFVPGAQGVAIGFKTGSKIMSGLSNTLKKSGKGLSHVGTRLQVYRGLADCTASGECKEDLMKNSRGRIVNKKRSLEAKKRYMKRIG